MSKIKSFCHSGALGDVVYSLPAIITQGGGDVYIKNVLYAPLKLFLDAQPCVSNVYPLKGRHRHFAHRRGDTVCPKGYPELINLDKYRTNEWNYYGKNNHQHLAKCHLDIFAAEYDLTKPWIFNIEPRVTTPIVVSRSLHYHDKQKIDWKLLEPYKELVTFLGFKRQYKHFVFYAGFEPKWQECENILEIAQVIQGSKLFLGNQSLCFALAEGLKKPRVLEVYHSRPNCNPHGMDGYTDLNNAIIMQYVTEEDCV